MLVQRFSSRSLISSFTFLKYILFIYHFIFLSHSSTMLYTFPPSLPNFYHSNSFLLHLFLSYFITISAAFSLIIPFKSPTFSLPQLLGVFVACVGSWILSGKGWDVLHALYSAAPLYRSADSPVALSLDFLPTLRQLALGICAVGFAVVITSLLGSWAAVRESRCGLGLVRNILSGTLLSKQ